MILRSQTVSTWSAVTAIFWGASMFGVAVALDVVGLPVWPAAGLVVPFGIRRAWVRGTYLKIDGDQLVEYLGRRVAVRLRFSELRGFVVEELLVPRWFAAAYVVPDLLHVVVAVTVDEERVPLWAAAHHDVWPDGATAAAGQVKALEAARVAAPPSLDAWGRRPLSEAP